MVGDLTSLKLDFIHHLHRSTEVTLNNLHTLSERSNRSPIQHSDIHVYQISAVVEQYVLYYDLEYSF